jgi:hypothetical protein
MQTGHCEQGMVFAINAPATGDKTFQNYKANALGSGTSTVVATSTASVTVSYPSPPAPSVTGSDTDEQCQCVCNIDVSNGYSSLDRLLTSVLQIVFKVLACLEVQSVMSKVYFLRQCI